MDLAFTINRKYIGQFKVTLRSVFESNAGENLKIHLLHVGLDEEDEKDLKRFCEGRAEIFFYEIDCSVFEGMPKMGNDTTYSAYMKVLIPYYLQHLERVLYLDCDIIVRKSLSPLFEDSGAFLSCVIDERINRKRKEHILQIIGKAGVLYFNSGVMLFDFGKSEAIVPREEVLHYMKENCGLIRWHDQDILNHFYAENCRWLELKYNYLTTYRSLWDVIFPVGKRKAVIVHYANWKPWNENYIGKYYRLYLKYYRRCKGEKGVDYLKKRNLKAQLKLIGKYLFRR